jgi:hypothetical protein
MKFLGHGLPDDHHYQSREEYPGANQIAIWHGMVRSGKSLIKRNGVTRRNLYCRHRRSGSTRRQYDLRTRASGNRRAKKEA